MGLFMSEIPCVCVWITCQTHHHTSGVIRGNRRPRSHKTQNVTNRARVGTNRANPGTNPPQAGTNQRREVPLPHALARPRHTGRAALGDSLGLIAPPRNTTGQSALRCPAQRVIKSAAKGVPVRRPRAQCDSLTNLHNLLERCSHDTL
jgi:hypothetical protein